VSATAIVYDIPLITADKQFKVVTELQLLLYDARE
jgi:predicted nucleic acid-binding protein